MVLIKMIKNMVMVNFNGRMEEYIKEIGLKKFIVFFNNSYFFLKLGKMGNKMDSLKIAFFI